MGPQKEQALPLLPLGEEVQVLRQDPPALPIQLHRRQLLRNAAPQPLGLLGGAAQPALEVGDLGGAVTAEEPPHQLLCAVWIVRQRTPQPPGGGSEGGIDPLPGPKDHLPPEGAGPQKEGHRRPAHRLPVGLAVHGGGIPGRADLRGEQGLYHTGQPPVQGLLAQNGLPLQTGAGLLRQGQQVVEVQPQGIQGPGDPPGVDPGLLPGLGAQGGEKDPGVFHGKDQGHAPDAPGLEQGLFPIQRLLQLVEGDTLHPVPQGGLPGPGGRVLHAADSGGLHQRSGGERPVQVVAAQAEGPGLFPSDGHGAASPGAGAS